MGLRWRWEERKAQSPNQNLDSSVNVFCLEKRLYEAHQGAGVQAAHITLPFV